MQSNAIVHEVQQLYNVRDRLDPLSEQHPIVSEGLTIAGSVRNTATLLEVLVATSSSQSHASGQSDVVRWQPTQRIVFPLSESRKISNFCL